MKKLFLISIFCLSHQVNCMQSNLTESLQELSTKITVLEKSLTQPATIPPSQTIQTQLFNPQTFVINNTTIHLIKGDITKLYTEKGIQVDAIVNAANEGLRSGGGVCGAIFNAAGRGKLAEYINDHFTFGIQTGQAITTPSFNLKSQGIEYIIHAVGPIYANYTPKKAEELLRDAYVNSLMLAEERNMTSIAFPFISSAIFGYPKPEAARVALNAVIDYVKQHNNTEIERIYFILFFNQDLALFIKELKKIVSQ